MFRIKLKELRDGAGLSQAQLAKRLGIAQSTIGHCESGVRSPSLDFLCMISDYFGVSIDWLLDRPYSGPCLSSVDLAFIEAYHSAPAQIKTIVHAALDPYIVEPQGEKEDAV